MRRSRDDDYPANAEWAGPTDGQDHGERIQVYPSARRVRPETDERIHYRSDSQRTQSRSLGKGQSESKLKEEAKSGPNKAICRPIYKAVSSWAFYHFHDTSDLAQMRRDGSVSDNECLRESGENL